ncbi:MAG: alpha/beta fold hydrolase [Phyllobacteriaceae bacterium]|nr:alpha/beta fold hydrolase [Phyllobacteriaceae bacterium]
MAQPHFPAMWWMRRAFAFHVQQFGPDDAPPLLMLHGTGASTHSFAALCAELGDSFRYVLVDLPGHGFTVTPADFLPTLPEMARVTGSLMVALKLAHVVGVGHSAGAAILMRMALDEPGAIGHIIAINAALEPMRGHAVLSPLAKGLFLNPFTPQMFAWRARYGGMTKIMLRATGSALDEVGMGRYQHLLEKPDHVRGALAMMANWDLQPLQDAQPLIPCPVTLIAAGDDSFVPPRISAEAASRMAKADYVPLAFGGHLVHETDADLVAAAILVALSGHHPQKRNHSAGAGAS